MTTLSPSEKNIIYSAMQEILCQTEWIDDDEFQTRLGIYRYELKEVVDSWPNVDCTDDIVKTAMSCSLGEICFGLNISDADWQKHFNFSKYNAQQVFYDLKNRLHF